MGDPSRRCLYCAATLTATGQPCPRCGVEAAHEPAAAAGGDAVPCPRCFEKPALARTPLGKEDAIAIAACRRCLGAWIDVGTWAALFDAAAERRDVGLGKLVPPPPGQGATAEEKVALVRCPVCRHDLDRAPFAATSAVIIDVCPAHGVWLDAAELVSVVAAFHRLEPAI